MALSRELRRRLQVEDEPLSKRLKLAENTFISTDLRVAKKEDLVLKWLCQITETDANDNKDVWKTIRRCLEFKNASTDIVLKSEAKELLIKTLITNLIFNDKNQLSDVQDCCDKVLSSSEMRQYFQSKPSCLGELIKALVQSATSEESSSGRICTVAAVDCFLTCYKHSSNKDAFTNIFLNELLYPLCGLTDKNRNDKLGAEIHKCIQHLLFGKSKCSQFNDYVEKSENNFANQLFGVLKKNAEVADEKNSIVAFLYVFRGAVASYKTEQGVIDVIFRNLVDSATNFKAKLLNALREHLANVTFDYQKKISDLTLFEYLERFIDEILSKELLESSDYEALAVIAGLNPLIIEAKLQSIFNKIPLEKKETASERESYGKLMISIVEAEVRLRREQKLVPWILKAVKQSLVNHEKNYLETEVTFPEVFKDQFSKCVSNMTSRQTTDLLKSLIYHLNAFCTETAEIDKNSMNFLLQANVDLIVAYFKGVRIYDHSIPSAEQEKFVLALAEVGKIITLLTDKILSLKHNKKMIVALLMLVFYWEKVYDWIKYYIPDAAPKSLEFPITEIQMNELVIKCDTSGCKKAMNRVLVQQIGRNLQGATCVDLSPLLDGLEKSWSFIINEFPHILSSMDNTQITEVARLLLNDSKTYKGDCIESIQIMKTENVQDNERLVTALVCQTFVDIAANVNPSTTKCVAGHVNVLKILNRGKLCKVLKEVKTEYDKNEWSTMSDESISVLEQDLRILLSLPLSHLSLDLRTLTLLVVYAIKKECENNETIFELCKQIMLDVLEKMDIDIINYIDPTLLIRELTHSQVMERVVVSSLRNVSSWEPLKELIKKCETDKESATSLLDCIEKVKSKLKSNQKELFKKAEHKLGKKLLDDIEAEVKDHKEVRRLTKALKIPVADNEIPEHLVDVVKSTLDHIFVSEIAADEKLLAEGLQLMKVVMNRRSKFELSEQVITNVWPWVMKNPSKEMVWPLLQATKSENILSKILNLLHKQTISGLNESDGTSFMNSLVVWDAIMNVDMGPSRNTLRIAAILKILDALLISEIPKNSWPGVLRLIQSIFSKHAYAIQRDIDIILLLAVRSLKEIELSACEDVLAICYSLVKFQVGFITDRLPVLLILYGKLVRLIVRESRKEVDSTRERQLRCLALDVAKFTNTLIKLKKYLSRISPYVVADLMEMFSEGVIPSYVKGPLEDSVGHILSICDHHAISLLSRALPTATQGIFKTFYETYNKFYKFTGKI